MTDTTHTPTHSNKSGLAAAVVAALALVAGGVAWLVHGDDPEVAVPAPELVNPEIDEQAAAADPEFKETKIAEDEALTGLPDDYVDRDPEPGPASDRPPSSEKSAALEAKAEALDLRKAPSLEPPPVPGFDEGDAGGLSDAEFRAALTRWPGPDYCTTKLAGRVGTGTVKLSFSVDSQGAVRSARPVSTSGPDDQRFASCLVEQADDLEFPSPKRAFEREASFVF